MQSIDTEGAMSSTQLTTAAPAGRELASREIDGTNDWTELAARANEGLEVCLLWNRSTGRVKVAVADARLDQTSNSTSPAWMRWRPSITRSPTRTPSTRSR